MNKLHKLVLITSILVFAGCDNFLDIKPKGYTIPENYNDYYKLMNDESLYYSSYGYINYLNDDMQLGDDTEFSLIQLKNKKDNEQNLYKFEHGQIFTPGNVDGIYHDSYRQIYTYNAVINNILHVKDGSDREKNKLRAEALFCRAYMYLNLVNVYAAHYDPATAEQDLGVPMCLSEDIGVTYKRVSVAATYRQIKKDLEEAIPHLGVVSAHPYKPVKSIGYAFIARMYLYMGNYQEAYNNAIQSLEMNDTLMDLTKYKALKGMLWGRVVTDDNLQTPYPLPHDNKENIFIRFMQDEFNCTTFVNEDLLKTFKRDLSNGSIDKRRELFYSDNEFYRTLTGRPWRFPGRTTFAPYILVASGFSNAEAYLIAAECAARLGKLNETATYLNKLRDHRIKNNVRLSFTDELSALKTVLDERRREYAFLDYFRLIDLKRLNKDPRFAKTIVHENNGQRWELPANDPRYIMPIPQTVLDHNPNMPQYPR